MKGEFIVSSRSYIDPLDALEAAFAGLLAQEAAAERGQARGKTVRLARCGATKSSKGVRPTRHRDIRGPSAGEEAVAGIASAVRSEVDRMTAHNTGINIPEGRAAGGIPGEDSHPAEADSPGEGTCAETGSEQCANPGYGLTRDSATAGKRRKKHRRRGAW
ncbi:hypothetical protein ASPNIDRAFT_54374 [Aspergillus niger ATCC 1015]|uniref:Uncharacterized protein n=3 Tax=Aspergillus TaxID=5052 RepID=A0A370PGW3_ASPPH|nr:uncharacterized protein BO96DRAFT_452971 [Aspergillus niger CBS 101883]EHA28358.1 hypothetical protein ASPNIDRAFT_54374 [Aspergillus niger ATCC 1015]PYH61035.1 hypothetical protein BO96DRAFT_452971 [Aspergillus niger CBS 101883]RDH18820.1 hypothetical protein M747DRAFT_332515 [Aspergillus niger ATCC 13496]RDK41431.1 hypothetical protein M752DRAFT_327557 [Aspergillus phoenicis ATCC 13157]